MRVCILAIAVVYAAAAATLGSVRGVVHDPDHRPVAGAHVTLRANASDYSQTAETNASGEFGFTAVPVGQYTVFVTHEGLAAVEQPVTVASGAAPVVSAERTA